MRNVYIIGAGQLGSRHLQALKTVNNRLTITVIDPNSDCLVVAKERYEAFGKGEVDHQISFMTAIPQSNNDVDLVIVATNSDVRKRVIEELLQKTTVKYMILEKLLFQRLLDYNEVAELLAATETKAWVNCCMRVMPFYQAAKQEISDKKIFYHVCGSQFGLITNAIHYLDHMAYLAEELEFTVDTSRLITTPISSKRKGFLELDGTLIANFSNGSQGVITCYPEGNGPTQVQIISQDVRMIVRESEGKAWVARAKDNWAWAEVDARIPYQSEMTTGVVEEILNHGRCNLVTYNDSMKIHINLLEPLLNFINVHGEIKIDEYPFT